MIKVFGHLLGNCHQVKYLLQSKVINLNNFSTVHYGLQNVVFSCLTIFFTIGDDQLTTLHRSDSLESTQSEREFRKKYQAITHRMVHRKSSAVMYSKILERTFGKSILIFQQNTLY